MSAAAVARTIAASTFAELNTLLGTQERATYRSNDELTRAARVLLRVAFLIAAMTLIAQGLLLLAAAGALGRLTFYPTPMDLRRVAHDPAWVITGLITEIRGEIFLVAGVLAMLTVIPVFLAWLSRAFTNALALGSDVGLSPEDAVLRAFVGSAVSILILMLALSFGDWWSRALFVIVLPGAGFVVTFLVLRRLWNAMGGERRANEQWRAGPLSLGVALWLYPLALVAQAGSISAFDCGWPCTDTEALIARAGSPLTFEGLSRGEADRTFFHGLNARYAMAGLLSIVAGALLIPVGVAAAGTVRQINSMQDALARALPQPTARSERRGVAPARRAAVQWQCESCDFLNSPAARLCQNCGYERR